jgi:chemotaxis methyl-accepting protein methylase
MPYIHTLPTSPSFTDKGLIGYLFGPMKHANVDVYYIESQSGHDYFMVSRKITRIYYVLAGSGYFTIQRVKYDVAPGTVVEVPPNVEFCYSGQMKLIAVSRPRWFRGNDKITKWNPDVTGHEEPYVAQPESWLAPLVRVRIFSKSPVNGFLRFNRRLWKRAPSSFTALRPVSSYGKLLHRLARRTETRGQAFSTYFLRNRPQLELLGRLAEKAGRGGLLRVAVLGCSTGAEAYSVAWKLRSFRPDLKLVLRAMDISSEAVETAKRGVYPVAPLPPSTTSILERMREAEVEQLFQRNGDAVSVQAWIREPIEWSVGDAGDADILERLGPQDVVIANNFLCHMDPQKAQQCLRNVARLPRPGGYLFVSGVDLDVRTKLACELGWQPVQELLEEIHDGDPCLRNDWPCHYAGLEPLDKRQEDWKIRYAVAFRLPDLDPTSKLACE